MKLLLISVDFVPHSDGVSTLSYHYARRLAEKGHNVSVVAPSSKGDQETDCGELFSVCRFPGYSLGPLRIVPFACFSMLRILRQKPDLIMAMNIGYGGLVCLMLKRFIRFRYITFAYAYEFLKSNRCTVWKALYRRIYSKSQLCIAISSYTRDKLISFGVSGHHILTIKPGVKQPLKSVSTSMHGFTGRYPVLGTCGRLIYRKGHDLVIRALPYLVKQQPDLLYLICGEGKRRANLVRLAYDLGVEDHVRFLGRLSEHELPGFYNMLDLFVLCGRENLSSGHVEGFGIVYLEAAAYGVPSIGTNRGGVPEAIVDGETGVLVEPDSSDALYKAMARLISDPERLRSMGRRARERALSRFSWDRQVDEFEKLLGKVCK